MAGEETPRRKLAAGKAAWLEPWESVPADMDEWLRGWGIDPSQGWDTYTDAQGWQWFVERKVEAREEPD